MRSASSGRAEDSAGGESAIVERSLYRATRSNETGWKRRAADRLSLLRNGARWTGGVDGALPDLRSHRVQRRGFGEAALDVVKVRQRGCASADVRMIRAKRFLAHA